MSRPDSDYQFVSDDIDEILNDLIEQYEFITERTVKPASPERLFLSWIASVLVEAYAAINYAGNQNIPSRAEGENLDALNKLLMGDDRPEATSATVMMRFHISEPQGTSILIPAETRVAPNDGSPVFATVEDAYIPIGETSVDVSCECEEEGTVGNGFAPGQIDTLIDVDDILYYDHCENIDESDGGSDVPEDDELYDLMVAGQDAYATAGARGAYEYWAKSVSTEIEDVVVNSPSAGTVCIYALMDDGEIASTEIKSQILSACGDDNVRPLTDYVTVLDPELVSYDIQLTYYLSTDSTESAAELEDAIREAVDDYVSWQCARLGRDINPSRLIANVIGAGAKRVDLVSPVFTHLVDGRSSPVAPQVAVVGNVSLTNGGYEDE